MLSKVNYQFNGLSKYQIPFPYFEKSDIEVTVGNEPASFSFISKSFISLNVSPISGDIIQIKRRTDISNIAHEYISGEIFDEDKINKNKLQLIYALQEAKETELESLETYQNGLLFLNLDMNNNQIRNLANSVDNLDSFTLGEALELLGLKKVSGFEVGHTIVSARSDQENINGLVGEWIPRDTEQQLLKTDYPELSAIYPETPGGIIGITADLTYPSYDFSSVRIPYFDVITRSVYFVNSSSSNTIRKIDQFGNKTSHIPGGSSLEVAAHNNIVVSVSSVTYTVKCSFDGGLTWNNTFVTGPTIPTKLRYVIHIGGKFIAYDYNTKVIVHSVDGINWIAVQMESIGIDFTKMSHPIAMRPEYGKGRWTMDGNDFIITSDTGSIGDKNVMYRVDNNFTSATELQYTASTVLYRVNVGGVYPSLDGGIASKKIINTSDGFIQFSSDFGKTLTREFDLKTIVPALTKFQVLSKTGDAWLATCFAFGIGSYIIKSEDNWLTASIANFINNPTDSFGNTMISSYCTDDIPDNELYQTFFSANFQTYDIEIGSNLTFDMPTMPAPSEGVGGLEGISRVKTSAGTTSSLHYNKTNDDLYYVKYQSSNHYLFKNNTSIISFGSNTSVTVYSEGNFGIINIINNGLYYSYDDFTTITPCTITSGILSGNWPTNIHYINGFYFTFFTKTTNGYLLKSADGITWDSIHLNPLGWSKVGSYPLTGTNPMEYKNNRYYIFPERILNHAYYGDDGFSLSNNFDDYQQLSIALPAVGAYYTSFTADGLGVGIDGNTDELLITNNFFQTEIRRTIADIGLELGEVFDSLSTEQGFITYEGSILFSLTTASESLFIEFDLNLQNPRIISGDTIYRSFSETLDYKTKNIEGYDYLTSEGKKGVFLKTIGNATQHKYYTKGK